MATADIERGPKVPSAAGAAGVSSGTRDVVLEQLPEPSEAAKRARERGEQILTLYQVNLFHAEAVLQKYLIKSKMSSLGYMMDWEIFARNLDHYLHAKEQYSTLRKMNPGEIPTFGGLLNGVEVAGKVLLDIEISTRGIYHDERRLRSAKEIISDQVTKFDLKTKETGIISAEARAEQDRLWFVTRERFVKNTNFAVFSGLSLIAPMLIMTLHPTLLTTLLTTSLFVIAIAATLAAVMNTAEPRDIVGATAAYAAVLVVFIGTSGGAGGGSLDRDTPSGAEQALSEGTVAGVVVGSLTGAMLFLFAAVKLVKKLGPDRNADLGVWWKQLKGPFFKKA